MLLSDVEFGAFLAYSPHGLTESARESRSWCRALKEESYVRKPPRPMSQFVVERLVARLPETPLSVLFGPTITLIPVPRSALANPGDLWVPSLLAQALVRAGLGVDVLPCLRRQHAVRKSATARPGERARPLEHFESLRVDRTLLEPDELLLIDDVVTRGATLLGAASRLHEAFPRARIRAFAVVRTISNPEEFVGMLAPVIGRISLRAGNAFREP
jgi:hypothetical protein